MVKSFNELKISEVFTNTSNDTYIKTGDRKYRSWDKPVDGRGRYGGDTIKIASFHARRMLCWTTD